MKLKEASKSITNHVIYELFNDEKLINKSTGICYSQIINNYNNHSFNKITSNFNLINSPLTFELLLNWVSDLNGFGFPVSLEEKGKNNVRYTIDLSKSKYGNKKIFLFSILTLIRYPFEQYLYYIPQIYFNLCNEYNVDENDYETKFLILQHAHKNKAVASGNTGHMLSNSSRKNPISIDVFYEKVSNHKAKIEDTYLDKPTLHTTWEGTSNKENEFIEIMKNKDKDENCKKVYVVGGDTNYANWLPFDYKLVSSLEEANFVLFTGGEDVSPNLYGEPMGSRTYVNKYRDTFELDVFKKAKEMNLPMLGICRGAQFLGVMNGTKLVQDQQNNHMYHDIKLANGETIKISSTHHQSIYPFNLKYTEYNIIGYTENLSKYHLDGNDEEMNPDVEVEIISFPKTKCLCIQGHPEYSNYQNNYKEDFKKVQEITKEFFN